LVTVRSKLFDESDFAPFITFEIVMSPFSCVKNTVSGGTTSIPTLNYDIHPRALVGSSSFDAFESSMSACTIKYKLTTPNNTVLNLISLPAHHSSIITDPLLSFYKTNTAKNTHVNGCGASLCGMCEGSCDSNADCKTGLTCFQRPGL